MKLENFTPICIEWNEWSWININILYISLYYSDKWFQGSLFGIKYSYKKEFIIDLLFVSFHIKSPIL